MKHGHMADLRITSNYTTDGKTYYESIVTDARKDYTDKKQSITDNQNLPVLNIFG